MIPTSHFALGEVATISTGTRPSPEDLASGGEVAYLNGGVGPSGFVPSSNTRGNTIAIPSRGSVGVVGYSAEPFWCGPLCYRISSGDESRMLTRFLYFVLKSGQEKIIAMQQTGSIPALNKKELVRFEVLVPPLEVQKEVVRVLDTFVALEESLESELDARRVQHAFYRDQILSAAGGASRSGADHRSPNVTLRGRGTPSH